MNWTAALLFATSLQVSAAGYSQGKITLSLKKASLQKVFAAIETQSGFTVWYDLDILKNTKPIDIDVKDLSLEQALTIACKDQPLEFRITDKMIVIKAKTGQPGSDPPEKIDVKGRVVNEKGEPLEGAAVLVKGTHFGTQTNSQGDFELIVDRKEVILEISFTGYQTRTIPASSEGILKVALSISTNPLDRVQIIAYGTTTRRLSTSDITTVTSKEIEEQPVSNPLLALEGRVSGLAVTMNNGVNGSAVKLVIRGQNSIIQGTDPFFVIDGVPYAPNNQNIGSINSAVGGQGLSPFNSINPLDIESIEILKDADALAIYGSRAANGAILITTKKGKAGRTDFNVSLYTGVSKITKMADLLNTRQFTGIRREALSNDGKIVSPSSAPDLALWDTTKYTDFKKMLIGGTANTADAQASISGGNDNTQFLLGSGFHQQATVFPGNLSDQRLSVHLNLNHLSPDKRLKLNLTTNFAHEINNLIVGDLTPSVFLSPNAPSLYDSTGGLVWQENGLGFSNPLAFLKDSYKANIDNLLSNLFLSYKVAKGLTLRSSFGYNSIQNNEISVNPIAAQNPANAPTGSSNFGNTSFQSWTVEPQAEYVGTISKGKLSILAGGTWQEQSNKNSLVNGSGYTSDALIRSVYSAPVIQATNNNVLYHYQASFARISYNWDNKYIFNLSGRRDGSSRFGPNKQFGNFGAIGAAWIFSNENFIQNNLPFISFGKLKGSYGITGNDQIGDYTFLDTWSANPTYQGGSGIYPTRLFNPDFAWEVNRKWEGSLDLGFLKDKLFISMAYYLNRSGNQLLAYSLPTQTGFGSITTKNLPAVVQNSGVELTLNSTNFSTNKFKWSTSVTVTIPQNKLVAFPNLAGSSYASLLEIGQPLNVVRGFRYTGVDPAKGTFTFEDINKDGAITDPEDIISVGTTNPKFYGGVYNTFSYKSWQLTFFIEGRKQSGFSYLRSIYQMNPPGAEAYSELSNQPVTILNRWMGPGSTSPIQQFTATPGTPAYNTINNFLNSSAAITDASFIRLKTVSFSYNFKSNRLEKWHITGLSIFLQGQNLLTLTKYKGTDPETQSIYSLPPLRTITAGLRINL